MLFASSRTEIAILSTSCAALQPPFGGHAVKAGFQGLVGIGAGAVNGKRFTFPRRGFPSNVPTLIGEEPKFAEYIYSEVLEDIPHRHTVRSSHKTTRDSESGLVTPYTTKGANSLLLVISNDFRLVRGHFRSTMRRSAGNATLQSG